MARLRILGKDGRPAKEVELKEDNRLGRHPSQDIQILDRVVSKSHARILERGNAYWLADLGSRNGTFLNGTQVTKTVKLEHNDEIRLGSTILLFLDDDREQGSLLDKVTIASEGRDTAIQEKLSNVTELNFLPEHQIKDEQNLRRDYEKLRIALELSQYLGIERDLDKLLNKILDKAFELFDADRGVILLLDERTGQLVPRHAKFRSVKRGKLEENIIISRTVLREVLQERAGVLSSDAAMDSRFAGAQSVILSGIRSTMSVPLHTSDKLLGIIYMDSLMSTGAFTQKDLQLLSGFANQAAVAIENSRLISQLEQEALARDRLGRLLSPNLVDQVVSGKLDVKQGGELRTATVLFSDIRGFTAMSERMAPQDLVNLLNSYFERMVDIIFKYEGTLDKFVGDEIMAVYGAPVALDKGPLRAVLTALEMKAALRAFNKVMTADGFPALEVGIGINTGEMVCGYMGSSKTMDYTVIGDAVNLGARLCSAAKPGQILVSETTYEAVKDRIPFEERKVLRVKGKSEEVTVYVVGEVAA